MVTQPTPSLSPSLSLSPSSSSSLSPSLSLSPSPSLPPSLPPKPTIILSVNILSIDVVKTMKFSTKASASEADAFVSLSLSRSGLQSERESKRCRLFRVESGGRPFGANTPLGSLGLKNMDVVYFRPDCGETGGGEREGVGEGVGGYMVRVSAPALSVSKVLSLPLSATIDDTILMAAAALARSKLLSSAEAASSTSLRHRLCRKKTGAGRLGPGEATLRSVGVKSGDEVFLIAEGMNAGRRFTRLLPSRTKHARVDVYLPHSCLSDWGKAGPPAASLFAGSAKIGYLVKEGSAVKSWKERLFVLHNETLYYFGGEDDASAKGWLVLTPASTVAPASRPKRDHVFVVTSLGRQLFLSAGTASDARSWSEAISARIALLGDETAHVQGLPVTPPEHTLVDTLWLDNMSVTGASIVERAMRRMVELPHALSKGTAGATGYTLHELTGESIEPDDAVADHLRATDYDETVGFVEVQLKPIGQFQADTAQSSGTSARQRANSATKEVSGTLRRGKNLLRAALRKGKSTALSTEEKGTAAAGTSSPPSSASPVSPRGGSGSGESESGGGDPVLSAAVEAAEPIAQLDVSVAKSKPKSAGRRPPTRKKREPKKSE